MIVLSPDAVFDIGRLREFLDSKNPEAAQRALQTIWTVFEQVEKFPALGRPTDDQEIRQVVIRFGSSGYVARYSVIPDNGDILILRIWHGREERP